MLYKAGTEDASNDEAEEGGRYKPTLHLIGNISPNPSHNASQETIVWVHGSTVSVLINTMSPIRYPGDSKITVTLREPQSGLLGGCRAYEIGNAARRVQIRASADYSDQRPLNSEPHSSGVRCSRESPFQN